MKDSLVEWRHFPEINNYVLLGEAGCGKSEIALNLAVKLKLTGKKIHLFDLDMTKPLFRARDLSERFAKMEIDISYEEQFMDAPTAVGGVRHSLSDPETYTILDVGGDSIGATAVGAYAALLQQSNTQIWYIVNPFRPWSGSLVWIDRVLSEILQVSHVSFDRLTLAANPNFGDATAATDVIDGLKRLDRQLSGIWSPSVLVVEKKLSEQLDGMISIPAFGIDRYICYPW